MRLRALFAVFVLMVMGSGFNCVTLQLVQHERVERIPDFDCIIAVSKLDPSVKEVNSASLKDFGRIQLLLKGDFITILHIQKGQDDNTSQPFLSISYQK